MGSAPGGGRSARLDASSKWPGAKQRGKELAARRETGASILWANGETGAPWPAMGAEGRQRWAWGRQRVTGDSGVCCPGARRACQTHTGRLPQEKERKERGEGMARKRPAPPTMNASAGVSSFSFRSPLLSSFPLEMADQPGQPCLNVSPWPYFGCVYGNGVTRQMEGFARCPAAHA